MPIIDLPRLAVGEHTDICLLLEGTYPYVKGGVSSWVHQLLIGLPNLKFSIVFLGSRSSDYPSEPQYEFPPNLMHLERHYLFDLNDEINPHPGRQDRNTIHAIGQLHADLASREQPLAMLLDPGRYLQRKGPLGEAEFLYGMSSWRYITRQYDERSTEPSFVDYFWTVRNLHRPLWQLAHIVSTLPRSSIYHSISTGYAGLLGAFAAHSFNRPYVLMEHGIYTKERRIELMNAEWIHDNRNIFQRDATELSYLREMWVRFFETMGRLAYTQAHPIISLYEAARTQQIHDGAKPEHTRIIPNGIKIERFVPLRRDPTTAPPLVLCLLGRVVAIKDIKTYIRAVRIVINRLPQAEAWVVGPEDEDPEYAEECHNLAINLDLGGRLRFLGFRRPENILPRSGVLVLSSISEGLPLVILEAFAAGLPVVATDVGACSELINGRSGEDAAIGRAGRIVGLADPEALAAACIELLDNSTAYAAARAAAIRRVERYYTRRQMLDSLRMSYVEAQN